MKTVAILDKDLADQLHVKEPQIQQYEATNYRRASLDRLTEVAQILRSVHNKRDSIN